MSYTGDIVSQWMVPDEVEAAGEDEWVLLGGDDDHDHDHGDGDGDNHEDGGGVDRDGNECKGGDSGDAQLVHPEPEPEPEAEAVSSQGRHGSSGAVGD